MKYNLKDLERMINQLNRKRGHETVTYNTVGAIKLSGAYGGYSVHLIVTEGGGVKPLMHGYVTKNEVGAFLAEMLANDY